MKKSLIFLIVAVFLLFSASAYAHMSSFYTLTAEGAGLSIDALGYNAEVDRDGETISAEIPANATIEAAFLYSASVWSNPLHDVKFETTTLTSDGSSRLDVLDKNANSASENRWDVTSIVASKYDGTGGIYNFNVVENGYLDGEILAVAYSVAGDEVRTALIFDGELATTGDSFSINLAPPYDGSSDAIFSLGISYGYQGSSTTSTQYTQVDINGSRLTSSAGGEDDGYSGNGGLITAGGVGDDPALPADPTSHGNGYAYDDELYNLASFLNAGDNTINIDTLNPSNDDNVFFAALTTKGKATVNGVPEPASFLLLGTALIGLTGCRKKFVK